MHDLTWGLIYVENPGVAASMAQIICALGLASMNTSLLVSILVFIEAQPKEWNT